MSADAIRFDDGAAYEQYMGGWSRLAGETFLEWLAPPPGARWLDVGCGNGAFTELLVERCAPASVDGIDPFEGQLAFARARPAARVATFRIGDAMALPFADATFDAAIMPLVIFFVPDPAKGVSEMARVVRPGGAVAAYAWDMQGGGFPYDALLVELRAMGVTVPEPPSVGASRIDALRELWTGAGLEAVETREIRVQRTFADFDDYWATVQKAPSVGGKIAAMTPDELARLRERLREKMPANASGRVVAGGWANAVRGRVPRAESPGETDDAEFRDALAGLRNGDFSRLEPMFESDPRDTAARSKIRRWHEEGRFAGHAAELAETLTCACFLGQMATAEHLARAGVDPALGNLTGMTALHWAANRGQLEAVRLLLRHRAPLEAVNMYGGTVLDCAVWSAAHEPRPRHVEIIGELLRAGANPDAVGGPVGDPRIEEMLRAASSRRKNGGP